MKNFEIVMEELKQLKNLDSKIHTLEGIYNKEEVRINSTDEKYSLRHGDVLELVHGIRAMKLADMEGTKENIEKGLRVFSMLQSIYCYHSNKSAEEMANDKTFTEKLYNIGFNNVVVLAEYLIKNTDRIETNTYTDGEGCIYNSIYLKSILPCT